MNILDLKSIIIESKNSINGFNALLDPDKG